jgi:adenylate cyclase
MTKRGLWTLLAIALAGLWGAGLGWAHWRGDARFLDRAEATMTDLRTLVRGPRIPPQSITIVAIDDEVVQQEGAYPVTRATLARIVDTITGLGPKAVALDLLLLDEGPEADDEALAKSLARTRSVIAGAAVFEDSRQQAAIDGDGALARVPVADRLLLPLKRFSDVAAVGLVNVATDYTGTPNLFPMLFRTGDRIEASFALQAASVAMAAEPVFEEGSLTLGTRSIKTDLGQRLPIAYYGPRGTIETISAAAVLNGQLTRENIAGRIVVIGSTVTGSGDVFPTPFDPVLPGVEVISTAILHLVAEDGEVRNRAVRLADAGLAVLLPMIVVGLLAWQRSAIALAAIAAIAIVWLMVNLVSFSHGIWLGVALPVVATVPPVILFGSAQIWQGRRRAQRFAQQTQLLQRFQSPGLGDWLKMHPDFLSEPVWQEAAIVFIDLSGFTRLSQTSGPTAVRELLDAFYKLVEQEVDANQGVITNFMGDGAMIVFGLPEPSANDASNAARCCTALATRAQEWLASLPDSVAAMVGVKLGAHFGTIIASRLGGGSQQQLTATGDTVNVANRLMEVAAEHGVVLALSDDLLQAAGGNQLFASGTLSGPAKSHIRGRTGTLPVWLWQSRLPG